MASDLQELKAIQKEYFRWETLRGCDEQERAAIIASNNFRWVLEVAIKALEAQD